MNNEAVIIVADDSSLGTLMSVAASPGCLIHAVAIGNRERAESVARAGVESVRWIPTDESTPVEAFALPIAKLVADNEPRLVLAPNSAASRSVLGAVAAQINAAVTSSVSSISFEGDRTMVTRSVAERRAVEVAETEKPVVALVLDGSDDYSQADREAPITEITDVSPFALKVVATHEETGGGTNLADAERVVGAGRGIASKDELAQVEELATALNAEVCCSLSLCDDYRWFEHSRVVGTSTQRISPRLYVSVGISGQPQHMSGVRGAKTIIAINDDPEAPIFRNCAYGIVGDLNKVVPALAAALA